MVQDAGLSRRKYGFESRARYHQIGMRTTGFALKAEARPRPASMQMVFADRTNIDFLIRPELNRHWSVVQIAYGNHPRCHIKLGLSKHADIDHFVASAPEELAGLNKPVEAVQVSPVAQSDFEAAEDDVILVCHDPGRGER